MAETFKLKASPCTTPAGETTTLPTPGPCSTVNTAAALVALPKELVTTAK